ncbi:MAG: glucose-6-phosphate isomerase [Burkholderiales bacterium]|nr:glucose-6-phosphate isomerase [Burkholderiales bacterium]
MPNYPSELQLCSAKAASYHSLYQEKAPSLLGNSPLLKACGLTLDISRQRITKEQLSELRQRSQESKIFEHQRAMAEGEVVNPSEKRAALHTLLREPKSQHPLSGDVQETLKQMKQFADAVRNKEVMGSKGRPFTDVINIGIGGSHIGPRVVWEVCKKESDDKALKVHWVSNVDGWGLHELLPSLSPETTLVIVSSKSFGTAESLLNAEVVKEWFLQQGINELSNHFILCSANPEAPEKIGISAAHLFKFWDWVGGRFSVWSSVGLPVLLAIGSEKFDDFLTGAHHMDLHALNAEADMNLPLTMALLSIWNSTAIGTTSFCFLPYDQRLSLMVNWLQQLEMESLGKSKLIDGSLTKYPTCTPVWGGSGNDAQHAFYQCLRQGTNRTAIDIVTSGGSGDDFPQLHGFLLANAKAQADVLVSNDQDSESVNCLSVIEMPTLSPYYLGALLALYEHKTTMTGFLLGINPFDQPGVELGKKLAQKIWKEEQKS